MAEVSGESIEVQLQAVGGEDGGTTGLHRAAQPMHDSHSHIQGARAKLQDGDDLSGRFN
jgi:hypothetical protein